MDIYKIMVIVLSILLIVVSLSLIFVAGVANRDRESLIENWTKTERARDTIYKEYSRVVEEYSNHLTSSAKMLDDIKERMKSLEEELTEKTLYATSLEGKVERLKIALDDISRGEGSYSIVKINKEDSENADNEEV